MNEPAQPEIALVLTTVAAATDDARTIAQTLVTERLAACVNVLPAMLSVYRWKGAVETAQEQQLVIKTTVDRLDGLKARLLELHPYAVPELLVVSVSDGAESYLTWLRESVG